MSYSILSRTVRDEIPFQPYLQHFPSCLSFLSGYFSTILLSTLISQEKDLPFKSPSDAAPACYGNLTHMKCKVTGILVLKKMGEKRKYILIMHFSRKTGFTFCIK